MKIYFNDYKEQIKEAAQKRIKTKDYYISSPYYVYNEQQAEAICEVINKRKYYIDSETGKEYISNPNKKCIAYVSEGNIKTNIDEAIHTFTNTLLNEIQRTNRGYNLKEALNY